MAAVAQIPAAVVSPFTALPFLNITPAPRKLMPLTACAAIRAGSAPRVPLYTPPSMLVKSAKPYFEIIIMSAAAQQTIIWVRIPASLSAQSLCRRRTGRQQESVQKSQGFAPEKIGCLSTRRVSCFAFINCF